MKFIILLLSITITSTNTFSEECFSLEGTYQKNLPQANIEDVSFEIVKQSECQNVRFYDGHWDTLLERVKKARYPKLKLQLDGKEYCEAFNFCTKATVSDSSIDLHHTIIPSENEDGVLCKSNRVIYSKK